MSTSRATIVLVEDDPELGDALRAFLDVNGFDLLWFRHGRTALDWLTRHEADLCLLDVMLPQMDGFAVAAALRQTHRELPVVFLTARALKPDRLRGFSMGADDYIVKPVDEDELVARIRAVLRRGRVAVTLAEPTRIGQYVFDQSTLTLRLGGERQTLTEREAALLALLCAHRGRLVRRDDALRLLWKKQDAFARRSMDVFVHRLRHRLRGDDTVSITTIRGAGLMLEVAEPASKPG